MADSTLEPARNDDQLLEDRLRWLVKEARGRHWSLSMAAELTEKASALLDLIERLRKDRAGYRLTGSSGP